jgi:hypothetical protein
MKPFESLAEKWNQRISNMIRAFPRFSHYSLNDFLVKSIKHIYCILVQNEGKAGCAEHRPVEREEGYLSEEGDLSTQLFHMHRSCCGEI